MGAAIERYLAINAQLHEDMVEYMKRQDEKERLAREERQAEQIELKLLHTRQLEELKLTRECAERRQERKEDEFLNPKEPLCKIHASTAEDFINESDKFEEQLFDNNVFKPRRMFILLKRAIQSNA